MPSPWHQELGCLQKCLWVMEKLRCNVITDGKGVTSAVGLPHKAVDQQLPWSSGVHLQSVALYQLFSFAEPCDYLLMVVGMIGALAHGAAIPVFFLFFG
ncbi:unnamed protein product [Sphagnum jensenii]|uniref:Uncharacterized protein n=1 Tax=Sphagnum jensenii TaxID=128206 RepID=A0ABP0W8K9_9BRYO